MQTENRHQHLIAAIKSTLDMDALGLSLVSQRHFSKNTYWPDIRDNTGSTIFVQVPPLPTSLHFPLLSPLTIADPQISVLDKLFTSSTNTLRPHYSRPPTLQPEHTQIVPLSLLVNAWIYIANILQLEQGPSAPHLTRKLVRHAFSEILEEAYQQGLELFPSLSDLQQRKLRYLHSFVLISLTPSNDFSETTPLNLINTLLHAPSLPWSVLPLLNNTPSKTNLTPDFLNPTQTTPSPNVNIIPASLACSQPPITDARLLAPTPETYYTFGYNTFGAPPDQLRSVFPDFAIREIPSNPTDRAKIFSLNP